MSSPSERLEAILLHLTMARERLPHFTTLERSVQKLKADWDLDDDYLPRIDEKRLYHRIAFASSMSDLRLSLADLRALPHLFFIGLGERFKPLYKKTGLAKRFFDCCEKDSELIAVEKFIRYLFICWPIDVLPEVFPLAYQSLERFPEQSPFAHLPQSYFSSEAPEEIGKKSQLTQGLFKDFPILEVKGIITKNTEFSRQVWLHSLWRYQAYFRDLGSRDIVGEDIFDQYMSVVRQDVCSFDGNRGQVFRFNKHQADGLQFLLAFLKPFTPKENANTFLPSDRQATQIRGFVDEMFPSGDPFWGDVRQEFDNIQKLWGLGKGIRTAFDLLEEITKLQNRDVQVQARGSYRRSFWLNCWQKGEVESICLYMKSDLKEDLLNRGIDIRGIPISTFYYGSKKNQYLRLILKGGICVLEPGHTGTIKVGYAKKAPFLTRGATDEDRLKSHWFEDQIRHTQGYWQVNVRQRIKELRESPPE